MKKLLLITSLALLSGFSLTQAQVPDPVSVLAAGGRPPFVGITDLDNDGDGDLVIVFDNVDSIVTLLGNGLGGFGTRTASGIGGANAQLAGADFADFNNDGNMDILVASLGPNHVIIAWGNGAGAFTNPIAGTGSPCYAVAAGYFDNDLNADIALVMNTASGTDSIRYWFGNGLNPPSGNFFNQVNVPTGGDLPFMMTKLLDSNFVPPVHHLAVSNYISSTVGLSISNGNRTFNTSSFATRSGPIGIVWDRLNNDNLPDIAVACYNVDSVFVHNGTNLTTYGAPVGYQVGSGPCGLAGGDFTGDGRMDLAAGNQNTPNVSFLVNNGSGGFMPAINAPARFGTWAAFAGDINNNGLPDLALGSYSQDSVKVFNLRSPSVSPSVLAGNPPSGAPFTLPVITARDTTNIASVRLVYRQMGKTVYDTLTLTAGAGTATQRDYTGTLPAGTMTNRGLEYFFRTSDGFVTANNPASSYNRLSTSVTENAPPTLNRSYQLVSLPMRFSPPTNGTPSIQIADDFSLSDPNSARLFWWDPILADTTSDTSSLKGYREFPFPGLTNFAFTPGRSMFLATVGSKVYDAVGLSNQPNITIPRPTPSGDSVPVEYYLALFTVDSGWNMIATPFPYTVHLDSVDVLVPDIDLEVREVTDPIRDNRIGLGGANLRERTAAGYIVPNPPLLKPWRGYFLKNNGPEEVLLLFPKIDANFPIVAPVPVAPMAAGLDWKIDIAARSGELEVPPTTLGTSEAALPGYDRLDWELPPALPGDLRVVFQRDKKFGQAGDYLTDIRPTLTESESWSFTVQPGQSRAIELSFGGLADIPEDYDVILTDVEGRAKQNLRLEAVYRFIASVDRHFELTVTPKTTGQAVLMPTKYELHQNFPNPFNPQTLIKYDLPEAANVRLEVFNILGQKVATLVDRYEAAGPKSALWDGTDAAGNKVSSGVYFYKLKAGDYLATKKMTFVK